LLAMSPKAFKFQFLEPAFSNHVALDFKLIAD